MGRSWAVDTTLVSSGRSGWNSTRPSSSNPRSSPHGSGGSVSAATCTQSCTPPPGVAWWSSRLRLAAGGLRRLRISYAARPRRELAGTQCPCAAPLLRRTPTAGLGIASVAAQRALASSLLELPVSEDGVDGEEADFPTVLAEASWDEPPAPSRLGPRWPAQTVKKGWEEEKKTYHNCGGISRIPLPYASCNQTFGVWLLGSCIFFVLLQCLNGCQSWCIFHLGRSVAKSTLYSRWNTLRTSATKAVSRSFLARIVLRWIDSTCGKRCLCWLFHVYLWRSVVDTFSLCIQLRFIHSVLTYVSVTLE